jgi:hypothetical protein
MVVPVVWAIAPEVTNDAEAKTKAAIRDFFISYLANYQPRPAAGVFKNRGTSSYQSCHQVHIKARMCALFAAIVPGINFFPTGDEASGFYRGKGLKFALSNGKT